MNVKSAPQTDISLTNQKQPKPTLGVCTNHSWILEGFLLKGLRVMRLAQPKSIELLFSVSILFQNTEALAVLPLVSQEDGLLKEERNTATKRIILEWK